MVFVSGAWGLRMRGDAREYAHATIRERNILSLADGGFASRRRAVAVTIVLWISRCHQFEMFAADADIGERPYPTRCRRCTPKLIYSESSEEVEEVCDEPMRSGFRTVRRKITIRGGYPTSRP